MRLVPDGFYFFDDFGIGRAGCDDVCKFFSFNPKFLQELSVSWSRIDVVTDAASQFCTGFICNAREPGHVAHVKLTATRPKINSGTEFVHCRFLLHEYNGFSNYQNIVILPVNSKLESKGVCAQHCVAVFFLSREGEVGKGFG